MKGKCQSCGNYDELEKINDRWLCSECKEREQKSVSKVQKS